MYDQNAFRLNVMEFDTGLYGYPTEIHEGHGAKKHDSFALESRLYIE